MSLNSFYKNDSHWRDFDRQMMARALKLAKKGCFTARPNPIVGCVIVNQDKLVGEGWHQTFGQAHAEVNALRQAGEKAKGATCYVTLEPCSHTGKTGPCAQALIDAGVFKVVAAMADPNPQVSGNGFKLLEAAGIIVEYGLQEQIAESLNPGFISQMTRNRPWVTCKLAMSIDGRTALADGSSQWITGNAARADVQKLRAASDAIITGSGTLIADNPSLTVRAKESWFEEALSNGFKQPKRVLVDRSGSASLAEKLFNDDTQVFWVNEACSADQQAQIDKMAHVSRLSNSSLEALLKYLSQNGCTNVLVEAGHNLAGKFFKQGLIDELVIYMAPKLMGNQAMGLIGLDVAEMAATPNLQLKDIRQFEEDIRLTYRI